MGEWSEYFEDFPEENPANYDERGRFVDSAQRTELEKQRLANQRLDELSRGKSPQRKPSS